MSTICAYCKKEHDKIVSGHMKQVGKLQKTNTELNELNMQLRSELATLTATPVKAKKTPQLKTWAQLKAEWASENQVET